MAYADLREYLDALEAHGLLHRVARPVDKGWEIAAVCRRAFQTIPPERRKAMLFEHVQGYDVPLVTGVIGASRRVYALAMETTPDGIAARWDEALGHPIAPQRVATGPVMEHLLAGDEVDLGRIPIPVWTVGQDPAPYITAPFVVTRDPETGKSNIGTYRAQVKGPRRIGLVTMKGHHALNHFRKHAELGTRCPVAVVLGCDPSIALVSVASIPEGVEEVGVAGGLRGAPVPVVGCATIDLEVPAGAEYVLEGYVDCTVQEMEGPFGEYTGYVGPAAPNYVMEVQAIRHRHQPLYQAFFSQMPPSESSLIRQIGRERSMCHHLRDVVGLPVLDVNLTDAGGAAAWLVIRMRKQTPDQPRQAIRSAWEFEPTLGKYTVVVDEDVDPRDSFMVAWAMAFRCQPHREMFLERDTAAVRLDPSVDGFGTEGFTEEGARGSKVGVDATMKHPYPNKALPPERHLATVAERWGDYGF